MKAAPPMPEDRTELTDGAYYFVLDDEDRVVHVAPTRDHMANPFLGQVLWTRLPEAETLLGPQFDEARCTGLPVEFTVFYAGRTTSIRAIPAADGLAVHVEPLTELNVRTLSMLAASLEKIEAELAVRAPVQLGRPARESPQALP